MENLRRKLNEMVAEAMTPGDNKSTNSDTMQDELSDTFSNGSDIISSISEYASVESHRNPNTSEKIVTGNLNSKNIKERAPKRWIISKPTEIEWRPIGGVKRWQIKHKPLGMYLCWVPNAFRVY